MSEPIEIHMFGRLHVRRRDGTVVRPADWSTGKTTDLLRLLALSAGQSVRADTLVDKLWPESAYEPARASLRTATSKIRQGVGTNCVSNHLGMLTLVGAWVDTSEFRTLAAQALAAVRAGDDAAVVTATRRTEALYVDDFHAHDDDSPWASDTRDELALLRRQLLAEAGDSALRMFWLRDAIDFAATAVAIDPSFERPHRTLMRAHAALGETELALRAFEHCRRALADELGADPSEQTRALHLAIVSGTRTTLPAIPFIDRPQPVDAVGSALEELHEHQLFGVVCVVGEPGSGRHAVVEAALGRSTPHTANADVLGPFDSAPEAAGTIVTERLADRENLPPGPIIVLASESVAAYIERSISADIDVFRTIHCPPLPRDALTALASAVLGGTPGPGLVDALEHASNRLAGRAVETLRDWLRDGRVMVSGSRIDLWEHAGDDQSLVPMGLQFRTLVEQLESDELRLVELLAVAGGPVTVSDVVAAVSMDRRAAGKADEVRTVLDRLVDRGAFVKDPTTETYEFREGRMQRAFLAWLRPATRDALERTWNGTGSDHLEAPTERRQSPRTGSDRRGVVRGRRASDRAD